MAVKRCIGPACPFRVRHGFAAEFAESVDTCRSCGGSLETVEPRDQDGGVARVGARLGFTVAAMVAVGLAVHVSAEVVDAAHATEASEASRSIATVEVGALAWIGAAAVVQAIVLRVARGRWPGGSTPGVRGETRRDPEGAERRALSRDGLHHGLLGASLLLASLVGAVGQVVVLGGGTVLELALVALAPWALAGAAAAVDRWGLGGGPSMVVVGLCVHRLIATASDTEQLAITLVVCLVAVILIARPARQRPNDEAGDLGLGVGVPTTSLLPALALVWLPGLDPLVAAAAAGLVGAGLAWVFARPKVLLEHWRAAFPKADATVLEEHARILARRALLRSVLLLVAVVLSPLGMLETVLAVVVAAGLVDAVEETRLWADGDVDRVVVDAPADSLLGAEAVALAASLEPGGRTIVQSRRQRALWRALGGWQPLRLVAPIDSTLVRGTNQGRQSSERAD